MTTLAMLLSFLMLILGGYGFSSTKVASLNLPLMQKIAPTVHSWAFLNPLACGLILFAYAVFSASERRAFVALQAVVAALGVLFLLDASSIVITITAFAEGGRPTLETLLMAESGVCALLYGSLAARRLLKTIREGKPSTQAGVDRSDAELLETPKQ